MSKKIKDFDKSMLVTRSFNVPDFRATQMPDQGPSRLEGHAAVFDSMTSIGCWYNEIIQRGAFDGCDFDDVLFFINHDSEEIPLARSRRNNSNSTMQLLIDNIGLSVRADIDTVNNADAKGLYSAVDRGDVTGMSFCFRVKEDKWDGLDTDMPTRTILKISKVCEVSAVNCPAYDLTDINARDKTALDNARVALDNARSQSLENDAELDIYKLKNKILGGI
jgi:HK97 family phage prohead protease